MKNTLLIIMSLVTALCIHPLTNATQSIILGSVAFPQSTKTVPSIRLYAEGLKLVTELDHESKRVSFLLPKSFKAPCYVLITEKILPTLHSKPKNKKNRTIECLKINPQQPYKLFYLTLVPKPDDVDEKESTVKLAGSSSASTATNAKQSFVWSIEERTIDADGKIPDHTVIMLYPSEYVETLAGGSEFELPSIQFKKELLSLVGSERKLLELSNKVLLNAIDVDPLHANFNPKIAFDEQHRRALIMQTV